MTSRFFLLVAAQLLWFWAVTIGAHVVANQSQCPDLVFFCGFLLLGAGLWVISTRSKL